MPEPNGGLDLDNDRVLFETGNLADATIVCGDRTWKVHKVILGSRCKWFKSAFYGNMMEAASGKIVLREQDPELVDIMLHFIYAKGDIGIYKLKDGKGLPALCVQLFRLADFFMLDRLKDKTIQELEFYLSNVLDWPDDKDSENWCPEWITETLDAVADAYKDGATDPILKTLLDFIKKNCHIMFRFKHAGTLLENIPERGKDEFKNDIIRFLAKAVYKPLSKLSLPVLSAFHFTGGYDSIYDNENKVSCLLNVVMEDDSYTFMTVDLKAERQIVGLIWMTPSTDHVKEMTSHPDSRMVLVQTQVRNDPSKFFYIVFNRCGDARLYVECYCRANPEIRRETAPSHNDLHKIVRSCRIPEIQ